MKRKYKHSDKFIMKQLSKNVSDTMDQQIRDVLRFGTGESYTGEQKPRSFGTTLKHELQLYVKNFRKDIAEKIGGDDLHEYCD